MARDAFTFPWARELTQDQRGAFLDDLWGAASGDNEMATLDAIEKAIAKHRPVPECPITEREAEFLAYMADGLTYEQVAATVSRSSNSVRATYANAFAKLGARCGAQAVAIALHYGWLPNLELPDVPARCAPKGPLNWQYLHAQAADQMRKNPMSYIEVGPYASRNGAYQAARRASAGLMPEFRPAGAFEARPHRTAGVGWNLRMRYLGEASTTGALR
ncbi:response regulator transcription factor [Streptomyces sp. NPDC002920]